jgi:hypothetical protein
LWQVGGFKPFVNDLWQVGVFSGYSGFLHQ